MPTPEAARDFGRETPYLHHQEDATLTGQTRPLLSPKDDFVFRSLFGDQNHIDMVVAFLKSFVDLPDEEYAEIIIADPNLMPEVSEGKTCILDLKLRTRAGEIIHIEIQRADTGEMRERMAIYGAKLLAAQIPSGIPYKNVKRVISVLIADFPLLRETADYHTDFLLRNEDGSIVLTNALAFHIFELCKIPRDEDGRKVWRWLKFLSAGTREEFDMLQQTYDELQKPVARLMEMSEDEIFRLRKDAWDRARQDEEARIRLNRAEGKAEGRAEGEAIGEAIGEARGEARGRVEGKAEVALSLLKEGFPVSMIAKTTGLSSDEIERLSDQ
jgi:predicted transposase/invertase (TIGR01784 family)